MRKRRIIMAAALWAATGAAAANPFIQPDPKIQRGAAEQLAKKFGGLRGAINAAKVLAPSQPVLDPVYTNAIGQPSRDIVSRAMPPGEWLRAKEKEEARNAFGDLRLGRTKVAMPIPIALPPEAPVVPPIYHGRTVRIVYTNNAPI